MNEDDESEEEEVAVEEEAQASIEANEDDEGQAVHNDQVAKTIRERAILKMEEKGVYLDPEEEKSALQIFPRVSNISYIKYPIYNTVIGYWSCTSSA